MHFKVCYVFYSKCSRKHVSAAIAAIFRAMLLLQKYKFIDVVSRAAITP